MAIRTIVLAVVAFMSAQVMAQNNLSVAGGWVRETPPGSPNGVAYLTVINSGARERVLGVTVSPDVAEVAEFHTHKHEDGMMIMQKVEWIEVPSGGQAVLKPHGDHVMLIGLKKMLKEGETVTIELRFENSTPISVDLPVFKQEPAQ